LQKLSDTGEAVEGRQFPEKLIQDRGKRKVAEFQILEIDKSRWKVIFLAAVSALMISVGALSLFVFLGIFAVVPTFGILAFATFILLFALLTLTVGFFCAKQVVQVGFCSNPVLCLEADGIRLRFSGDLLPYDKLARVDIIYVKLIGMVRLELKPDLILKYHHLRFFARPAPRKRLVLLSLFQISHDGLGSEIERRRLIAQKAGTTGGA
jgi:hypothetical protein